MRMILSNTMLAALGTGALVVVVIGTTQEVRELAINQDIAAPIIVAEDIAPALDQAQLAAIAATVQETIALPAIDPTMTLATTTPTNPDATLDQALNAVEQALATSEALLNTVPKASGTEVLKNHLKRKAPA